MKKIISLLLVLAMLIFTFASCSGNEGSDDSSSSSESSVVKDDDAGNDANNPETSSPDASSPDGSTTDVGEKEDDGKAPLPPTKDVLKALIEDLNASAQKLSSSSKFSVTYNITSTASFQEISGSTATAIATTIDATVTIAKDGRNVRIYGDLGHITAAVENSKFDFIYVDETLYVSFSDINVYIPNLTADDITTIIEMAMESLNNAVNEDMTEEDAEIMANLLEILENGVLKEAISNFKFTDCANFEDVLTKALATALPVIAYMNYGENWADALEEETGMNIDELVAAAVAEILEEIPEPVLDILNSEAVMNLIKSDLLEKYVDANCQSIAKSSSKEPNKTYTVTVKKELFEDVLKVIKMFYALENEKAKVSGRFNDVVLVVSFGDDNSLENVSLSFKASITEDGDTAGLEVDFNSSLSYDAEITAPADLTDFVEIDKDEFMDEMRDIFDIKERHDVEPGYNALDGIKFVYAYVEVEIDPEFEKELNLIGLTREDVIQMYDEEFQNEFGGKYYDFAEYDDEYYFDGYYIYEDGELVGAYDGYYLIAMMEYEGIYLSVYFEIAEIN